MIILLFFSIYLLTSFAITRVRAELGSPVHDFSDSGTDVLLIRLFRTRRIGAQNLTIFSFFWTLLYKSYHYGMVIYSYPSLLFGQEPWGRLQWWLQTQKSPDYVAVTFVLAGGLFTWFLMAMRSYFIWWPFHPVGYVVSGSWAGSWFWFPIFIAWLLKWLILRHGGLRSHRKATPFFFGLIIGEYVVMSLFFFANLFFGIPVVPSLIG